MNNNNKKISIWFPSLIYENILEDFAKHNDYLSSKAYKIKSESTNLLTNWSCDTYSTLFQYNAFNDEDAIIKNLIKYKEIKSINNPITAAGIPFAVTIKELMKVKVK